MSDNIANAVSAIEAEFAAREARLSEELVNVRATKSKNAEKANDLKAREKLIAEKEQDLAKREDAIKVVESAIEAKEAAREALREAAERLERAKKLNSEADIFKGEARQALEEQTRRELALNKEKAEYKDKIKRDLLEKALNLR